MSFIQRTNMRLLASHILSVSMRPPRLIACPIQMVMRGHRAPSSAGFMAHTVRFIAKYQILLTRLLGL